MKERRVDRFGGTPFRATLYSEPELVDRNGRVPEEVVARQMSATLEDHAVDHVIKYELDTPPYDAFPDQSDCDTDARAQFKSWLIDDAPDVEADANLLLMDTGGAGCANVGGISGICGARHIDRDPGTVVRNGTDQWTGNVTGAMHEIGHMVGYHHDPHPGEGWNEPTSAAWHRTPNNSANNTTNICGAEIPNRIYSDTVHELWWTACAASNMDLAGSDPLSPERPVARFDIGLNGRTIVVDASASSDPDGTVESYYWETDRGHTASGQTASFHAPEGGRVEITLTVSDDAGNTGKTTGAAVVPNDDPVAEFTYSLSGSTITVDARDSYDPNGSIQSYAWTTDRGHSAAGQTASFDLGQPGTVNVALQVDDGRGGTDTLVREVEITNSAPNAAFTTSRDGTTITVDASASSDPDGRIQTYVWSTDDGQTAQGQIATLEGTPGETLSITLHVTDAHGADDFATETVDVPDNGTGEPPEPAPEPRMSTAGKVVALGIALGAVREAME